MSVSSPRSESFPVCSDTGTSLISRRTAASEVIHLLVTHQCTDLSGIIDLSTFGDNPVSHGGFSDIYQGHLLDATRSRVAVKAVRFSSLDEDPEHPKLVARELHTWSKCRHPNVVPLLGLAVFRGRVSMVSPWMEKGTLPRFLQRAPNADRHSLCVQICEGLSYLHEIGITHGDLKGGNVLVSDTGVPALTDFGNSLLKDATVKFTQREGQTSCTSLTLRWSAPELIAGTSLYTTASDVYALGMTILETISGKHPYYGKSDTTVMFLVVMKKEPPERPEGITLGHTTTDRMWELLLHCWSQEPENRPNATKVTEIMRGLKFSVPISHEMPLSDVVKQLELHGCQNVTNALDHTPRSGTRLPTPTGGYNNVYASAFMGGSAVALKMTLRVDTKNDVKQIAHEIYVLSKCKHPNILTMLGFAEYHGRLAMVSPWVHRLPLSKYIQQSKEAYDNRISFLAQLASGVAYIHGQNMVHGDINGSNVLVGDGHTIKLAGFGSSTLQDSTLRFAPTQSSPVLALRWAAPEVIQEITGRTIEADVYSLGMTILECTTGMRPYSQVQNEVAALAKIMQGVYPERPAAQIPNNKHGNCLWELLERCWSRDIVLRPTATEVERVIATITSEGLEDAEDY